jgi:putative two-component system response regulator
MFLGGEKDGEAEAKALKKGAVDYLRKPFEPLSLLTRVGLQVELSTYKNNLEAKIREQTEELLVAMRLLSERDKVMLNMLAELSDLRDHDTGAHILRTVGYTKILVKYILANPRPGYELTQQEGDDIIEAVKLHDLGKITIPDAVLLKPGRLTPEEFEVIKTHTTEGAKMLERSIQHFGNEDSLLETAYDIAYEHHEKWSGSGYPRGLSGEAIKLSARISAISDVFDALTSTRPYKRPFSTHEAFEIMYNDSGVHFDPYLIKIVKLHENEFVEIVKNYHT